jgi:methionyl-tRNA formyltransferase
VTPPDRRPVQNLRIAFAGTPEFPLAALDALAASQHSLIGVWTQPDRPAGRGRTLAASPVKQRALELKLPVQQPENFKTDAAKQALSDAKPDVMVVVAYGLILPKSVLAIPRYGCLNIHASLLPRWRGAAPIQRAIMAGDHTTGVAIMRMTEGLDEGPILASETLRIGPLDTAATLHDRMAQAGAELLARTLPLIESGAAREVPQAQEGVTYAKKIRAKEARIDWTRPAAEVDRKIRGLSPYPGAWFQLAGDKGPVRAKALLSAVEEGEGAAGAVLDDKLLIACGEGAVRLLRVQREGRGAQEAEVFLRGSPVAAGTKLG